MAVSRERFFSDSVNKTVFFVAGNVYVFKEIIFPQNDILHYHMGDFAYEVLYKPNKNDQKSQERLH